MSVVAHICATSRENLPQSGKSGTIRESNQASGVRNAHNTKH